jgi:hypothetical protein
MWHAEGMWLRYGLVLAAQWAWAASGTAGFNYALSDPNAMIGAIAVDAAGNTYVTGSTCSATFATTPGAFQTQYGGGACQSVTTPGNSFPLPSGDAFVVKLDQNGNVVWATYLGGSGEDVGQAIAVDAAGNVYVAGTTAPQTGPGVANNFPVTAGSVFPSGGTQNGDGFVVKLNGAGSQMIYGTYLPGMAFAGVDDALVSMALDSGGSVYVAGEAEPAQFNFPTTAGAYQTSSSAKYSGVIAKLNAAGSALVYATYLDGADPLAIAVDSSGNAIVTGCACASGFPVTAGAFQIQASGLGTQSPFVTKLNASGSGLIYSTYLGAGGEGLAVKVDSQGRAYILGISGDFPTTPGAFTLPPLADGPQFLASLSADGSSLVYGTYVGEAAALDVDASGNAYVGGAARGGFPVSSGAFQRCYSGGVSFGVGTDGFVAQFTPSGALAAATYFGGLGVDSVYQIAVAPSGYVSVASGTRAETSGNTTYTRNDFVASFVINNPAQQDGPCMSLLVLNAASYYSNVPSFIAPGELVTLQGSGFGPDSGV